MFNTIITGSGRSGTSLTAQLLHDQGFQFPSDLLKSSESNPNGYFESYDVNRINEALLQRAFPNHGYGQRWLAALHSPLINEPNTTLAEQIRSVIPRAPFVLKDPRFSYTLDTWLEHISDCRFICVFRNPIATVNSIQKMLTVDPHLRNYALGREQTFAIWNAMYSAILSRDHSREGWLFLEYESLLSGPGLQQLSTFTGTKLDGSLIDLKLQRSHNHGDDMPLRTTLIYHRLLGLSRQNSDHQVIETAAEPAF